MCMTSKDTPVRQRFTAEEDALLKKLVSESNGPVNWKNVSEQMQNRTARQCRERYKNYLKPNIIKKNWTREEDTLILKKYAEIGSKWESIARYLVGRSGNDTRNRYLSLVREKKYKVDKKYHPINYIHPQFMQYINSTMMKVMPPVKNDTKQNKIVEQQQHFQPMPDFEKTFTNPQAASLFPPPSSCDQDMFSFYSEKI